MYVLLTGAVDPSTAHLCEQQGQISMRECIDTLLQIDISKNTQLPNESDPQNSRHGGEDKLDGAYAIKEQCLVEKSAKSESKKFKHLSYPEVKLMQVEYKVVHGISVNEFNIDPFVEAQMVKEQDSYVIFRKDRKPVCCLREQMKRQDIQAGQILYFFKDTHEKQTYEWVVLDAFPTMSMEGMFLKAKPLTRRRLVLPQQCISHPVITAQSPDSIWRWFINIDIIN